MFLPSFCHAQTKCPWLNQATAEGFLGGPAEMAVKLESQGGGVCQYSRPGQPSVRQLLIQVAVMSDISKQYPQYVARCGSHQTPVQAIGNEAVMCNIAKNGRQEDAIVGRVRDQAFVIIVSSTGSDESLREDARRKQVTQIAEQVAGMLF